MQIKNRKWKSLILAVVSSFLLIAVFDLEPRFETIVSMVVSLKEHKEKIQKEKESEIMLKDLTAENRMLKGEVKSATSDYEVKGNISSVVSLLDSAAGLSKVKIMSIKPQKNYKKDNLWLQPIEVNISSKYEMVYNYIMFLENAPKVILVRDLNITSGGSNKDSLVVKADLEVYLNL